MTININKVSLGTKLTLELDGVLDTNTAPELEKVIKESLRGVTKLIIDLSDLTYISSAGLRVLLYAHKTMMKSGEMVITNADDTIMEVFKLTGFSTMLNFE